MKASDIYSNYWLLNSLLNKKYPFFRIVLLFFCIFLIGFTLSLLDQSLVIKSGESKFIIQLKNDYGKDTIKLADNMLSININRESEKKIRVWGKLINEKYSIQKQDGINDFDYYLTLVHRSQVTFVGQNNRIIMGRHFVNNFKLTSDLVTVKSGIYGVGYLEDVGTYSMFFAFILVIYFLKNLSDKFIYAFTGKENNDLLTAFNYNRGLLKIVKFKDEKQRNSYERLFRNALNKLCLNTAKAKYYSRWYYAYFILIVVFYTFINYGKILENWNFSPDIFPIGFWSILIKDNFLFLFLLLPILLRVTLVTYYTIYFTNLFNKKKMFHINPVSQDRAGGLSPLGEVTLYLFYMSISFFPHLFAVSIILGFPITIKILAPLYFGFTFYLFYFPLSAPHKSMKIARQEELGKIAVKYNIIYERFINNNLSKNYIGTAPLDELQSINNLYNQTRKMPVWPFDLEIFVKFGAAFFSSIFAYLLQLIIALIK